MPQVLYKDIRTLPKQSNPFIEMRPSASSRITKGTLEATMFATLLTYGFTFNGFGIHTYYLQTVGEIPHSGAWRRLFTIGSLIPRFLVLTLPFFYTKEVIYGAKASFTVDKPNIGKYLNYSFVDNILSTVICLPLFYLVYKRKLMAAARSSLLLCTFSMANDLFIEFQRKSLIAQNYTDKEVRKIQVQRRIRNIKDKLNQRLKDSNANIKEKRRIHKIDFEGLEKTLVEANFDTKQQDLEAIRQQQLMLLGVLIDEELKFFKALFE